MIDAVDNPDERRYEIRVDGELADFSRYRPRSQALAFIHTEVDDRFEGQGLAGQLISFALDDARSRGLAVLPFCPFVKGYIERHPEYLDLVPVEKRGDFGLAG